MATGVSRYTRGRSDRKEDRRRLQNLKNHSLRMNELIAEGMHKELASRKAFEELFGYDPMDKIDNKEQTYTLPDEDER